MAQKEGIFKRNGIAKKRLCVFIVDHQRALAVPRCAQACEAALPIAKHVGLALERAGVCQLAAIEVIERIGMLPGLLRRGKGDGAQNAGPAVLTQHDAVLAVFCGGKGNVRYTDAVFVAAKACHKDGVLRVAGDPRQGPHASPDIGAAGERQNLECGLILALRRQQIRRQIERQCARGQQEAEDQKGQKASHTISSFGF